MVCGGNCRGDSTGDDDSGGGAAAAEKEDTFTHIQNVAGLNLRPDSCRPNTLW